MIYSIGYTVDNSKGSGWSGHTCIGELRG